MKLCEFHCVLKMLQIVYKLGMILWISIYHWIFIFPYRYLIDMGLGVCSCPKGYDGSACKHQHLIWVSGLANCLNFNFSTSQRQEFAFIALGVAKKKAAIRICDIRLYQRMKHRLIFLFCHQKITLVLLPMSLTVHPYPQLSLPTLFPKQMKQ